MCVSTDVCGVYKKPLALPFLKNFPRTTIKFPWVVLYNDKNHNHYSLLNYSSKIYTLLSFKQSHEGKKKQVRGCAQGWMADNTPRKLQSSC